MDEQQLAVLYSTADRVDYALMFVLTHIQTKVSKRTLIHQLDNMKIIDCINRDNYHKRFYKDA